MSKWTQSVESTVEQWVSNSPLRDLSQNAKTFLIGALQKMDVVTREEYDVQVALLARTREKLEALEKQVTALEQQLSSK